MRSPDCGYSSTASSWYMSCSTAKSFASAADQWRLSAARISFSSIPLLPFLADPTPCPLWTLLVCSSTHGFVTVFQDPGEHRLVDRYTVWTGRGLPSPARG